MFICPNLCGAAVAAAEEAAAAAAAAGADEESAEAAAAAASGAAGAAAAAGGADAEEARWLFSSTTELWLFTQFAPSTKLTSLTGSSNTNGLLRLIYLMIDCRNLQKSV